MKNVLIINEGHTSNLGDKLIQITMKKLFEGNNIITKKYVPIETYESMEENILVGKTPNYINTINKIIGKLGLTTFLNDLKFRKLIKKELKNINVDLAIIGGGELVSDNQIFNSALYCWTNELKARNIPFIITGVSGNECKGKIVDRYCKAFSKAEEISVRDKKTQEMMKRVYDINAEYIPDVAFLYKKLFADSMNCEQRKNALTVQIYCKHYLPIDMLDESLNDYFDKWVKLINSQKDHNKKIILSYTNKEDRDYTIDFYNYCIKNNIFENLELRRTDSIKKYVELLGETNMIITGRMHAMILAMLFNNKIEPFAFKEKIAVFCEEWINSDRNLEEVQETIIDYIRYVKNKYDLV